jgi:hypothetical protein
LIFFHLKKEGVILSLLLRLFCNTDVMIQVKRAPDAWCMVTLPGHRSWCLSNSKVRFSLQEPKPKGGWMTLTPFPEQPPGRCPISWDLHIPFFLPGAQIPRHAAKIGP